MENISDPHEKKSVNKAKSYSSGPSKKLKSEQLKRKSFNVNRPVGSIAVALGRLRRRKLLNGEYSPNSTHPSSAQQEGITNMFIDSLSSPSIYLSDPDNGSSISMNFSHYELMRNLSQTNCNSDSGFSNTTCVTFSSLSDIASRDEHLERYFRSVELFNRGQIKCETNSFQH